MRKAALSVLLSVLWAGTPARATGSAETVLADARAALDAGDAVNARRLVDDELKRPGLETVQRARLLVDRGLAFELMGSHELALVDFTAAIDAHALPIAEQAQALLQRGFLQDSQGRLKDALGDYTAAIRLAPDSAQAALNNRASIYRRQNRFREARRDYLSALDGDNPHPEYPYTGLGQIAEAEGDIESARRFYTKAAAANAHYVLAAERLAALGGSPDPAADPVGVHLRSSGATPPPVDPPVAPSPRPGVAATSTQAPAPMPRKAPPLRPAIEGEAAAPAVSLVQLGAWRSRADAVAGWNQAIRKSDGALEGMVSIIQAADLPGKGRFYRLRVTPGPEGAQALCDRLAEKRLDCLIVPK